MQTFFLGLLVIITPISHLDFMPKELMGIPGNNPVNLVWIIAMAAVLGFSGAGKKPVGNYFSVSLNLFLAAYVIAALWTAIDLDSLHPTFREQKPSLMGFLLSNLFKPMQNIITGWLVYKYCLTKGSRNMEIATSLVPVILLPFMLYYFYQGSSGGADYNLGRDLISAKFGMHANDIGCLVIMVLAYNFGKEKLDFNKLDYLSIGSTLIVIALTFSRMAFIGTLVIFLLGFKKFTAKQKMSSIGLLVLVIMVFSPMLISRINYGITKKTVYAGQAQDMTDVSAGRVDFIWKPSLHMIANNPVFGQGILSIWKGEYITERKIMKPANPHNAYLQVALDMGIVGVLILIVLFRSMWKISVENKGFRYALISWWLMGLTGATFYPVFFTITLFIYYAITCAQSRKGELSKPSARISNFGAIPSSSSAGNGFARVI